MVCTNLETFPEQMDMLAHREVHPLLFSTDIERQERQGVGVCTLAFILDRYGHQYEVDDDGLSDRLDNLLGAS